VLTGDDLPAFELIRAEQDNLVQALRHGLDRRDAGTVAAVSAVLGELWMLESSFARVTALAGDTARILPPFRPEPALVEATRASLVLGAVSGFLLRGPSPARFLVGLRRLPAATQANGTPAPAALVGIAVPSAGLVVNATSSGTCAAPGAPCPRTTVSASRAGNRTRHAPGR
jgi:hypothetical protein